MLCASALFASAQPPVDPPAEGAETPRSESERTIAGIDFVWCPPGTYMRGLSVSRIELEEYFKGTREEWYADALPRHEVRIAHGFWMSKTEVTRVQWFDAMQTRPWEAGESDEAGAGAPATHITWKDAVNFTDTLTRDTGEAFRLPTEAEWEYACRAGTDTLFSFGNDRTTDRDYMWHWGNTVQAEEAYPHKAGVKRPNDWGLHDMHGNVWEWCQDVYAPYTSTSKTDPVAKGPGGIRVIRGASFQEWSSLQIASYRSAALEETRHPGIGIRLVVDDPR